MTQSSHFTHQVQRPILLSATPPLLPTIQTAYEYYDSAKIPSQKSFRRQPIVSRSLNGQFTPSSPYLEVCAHRYARQPSNRRKDVDSSNSSSPKAYILIRLLPRTHRLVSRSLSSIIDPAATDHLTTMAPSNAQVQNLVAQFKALTGESDRTALRVRIYYYPYTADGHRRLALVEPKLHAGTGSPERVQSNISGVGLKDPAAISLILICPDTPNMITYNAKANRAVPPLVPQRQ